MVTPRASHAHTTGALRPPQPPHHRIPVTPRPTATPWRPHSGCTATSQSKPALSVPTHGGPLGGGAAIGRGLMGPAGGLPLSGTSGDMPVVGARGVLHPQPPGGQVPVCSCATRPQRLCKAWGGQRGSAPTPHTAPHNPLCPGTRGCPRRAAQEHGDKEGAMEPTGAGDTEQCPGSWGTRGPGTAPKGLGVGTQPGTRGDVGLIGAGGQGRKEQVGAAMGLCGELVGQPEIARSLHGAPAVGQ